MPTDTGIHPASLIRMRDLLLYSRQKSLLVHKNPLVDTFGDLLDLVVCDHIEDQPPAIDRGQRRLGAHDHADRRGGQMADVDTRADRGLAGFQQTASGH